MVAIPPDERSIYLAFKDVFKGPDAQLRANKTIKRKIQEHKNHSEEIKALIKEYNADNVGNSVRALLKGDIFGSTLKAKIRFPELFDVSPAQSAERAASEAEAAKNEVDAINEVALAQQDGTVSSTIEAEHASRGRIDVESVKEDQAKDQGQPIEEKLGAEPTIRPVQEPGQPETYTELSLYPLYLPTRSQRQLLGKVQDILENACYNFGKRKMAEEMHKRGWESPDCVELNVWMRVLKSKEELFDAEKVNTLGVSFAELRSSISSIRHTAVHRLRITAGRAESLLADAETFAALLGDETCARQLSRLRRETRMVVEEFGRNKDLLELRYLEKRKEIAARRAELDRLERMAWDITFQEDKEYQSFAGAHLEDIVNAPETALHSAANSDGGETSEEDTSVESEDETGFCSVKGTE